MKINKPFVFALIIIVFFSSRVFSCNDYIAGFYDKSGGKYSITFFNNSDDSLDGFGYLYIDGGITKRNYICNNEDPDVQDCSYEKSHEANPHAKYQYSIDDKYDSIFIHWKQGADIEGSLSNFFLDSSLLNKDFTPEVSCENGYLKDVNITFGDPNNFVSSYENFRTDCSSSSYYNSGLYFYGGNSILSSTLLYGGHTNYRYNKVDKKVTFDSIDDNIPCNSKIYYEFVLHDETKSSKEEIPILKSIIISDVRMYSNKPNEFKICIPESYEGMVGKIVIVDSNNNKYENDSVFKNSECTSVTKDDLCNNNLDPTSTPEIDFYNNVGNIILKYRNTNNDPIPIIKDLGTCEESKQKTLTVDSAELNEENTLTVKYHTNFDVDLTKDKFTIKVKEDSEDWKDITGDCQISIEQDNHYYTATCTNVNNNINKVNVSVQVGSETIYNIHDIKIPNNINNIFEISSTKLDVGVDHVTLTMKYSSPSGYNYSIYGKYGNDDSWKHICDIKNESNTWNIENNNNDKYKCDSALCSKESNKVDCTVEISNNTAIDENNIINEINVTATKDGNEILSASKKLSVEENPYNQISNCDICSKGECVDNAPRGSMTIKLCNKFSVSYDNGNYKFTCGSHSNAPFSVLSLHVCHACGALWTYAIYNDPTKGGNANTINPANYYNGATGYDYYMFITPINPYNHYWVKNCDDTINLNDIEINEKPGVAKDILKNILGPKNQLKMDLYRETGDGDYGTCSYTLDPGYTNNFVLDVAWMGKPIKNGGIPENCGGSGKDENGNLVYGLNIGKFFIYFDSSGNIHGVCQDNSYCGGVSRFDIDYSYGSKTIHRVLFYGIKIDTSKSWNQDCIAPPLSRNGIDKSKSDYCNYKCTESSTPDPKLTLEEDTKIINIDDGSTINVIAGRNLLFKLKQPKYRTVVWIFNITKDGSKYDTTTSYCVPSWSGNTCFPLYARFDQPGDYTVTAKFYYAKTGSIEYKPKVYGECQGTEWHQTELCKTTNPIWYFLSNIFSKNIDDYTNPMWQQLINFIIKKPTFYDKERVPECIKICYKNGFDYKKSTGEEDIEYDITPIKTIKFNVHANDPGIKVDMEYPTSTPKDGEVVPVKFIIHIKGNNIAPSSIFIGSALIKPNETSLSYNNPRFYQEWIPSWGGIKADDRPCKSSEREADDKICKVLTTYIETDSICRKATGYDEDCLSKCKEGNMDMGKCPILLFGSYTYYNFNDPNIVANQFMPISVSTKYDNSLLRRSYAAFYVQPQEYSPERCDGASIKSMKIKNSDIDFGGSNEIDLTLIKPQGDCYYYIKCDAENITMQKKYSVYMSNYGKFSDLNNDEVKLSSSFYKDGVWNVKCYLYSSKDAPYAVPDVQVDEKEGSFTVDKPTLNTVYITGNDVYAYKTTKFKAIVKDSSGHEISPEELYFNWSLNCNNAKIIGKKEGYDFNSVTVKGLMPGNCVISVNASLNAQSVRTSKSFTIKQTNIGYNGYEKRLFIIPQKVLLTRDSVIPVKVKITGYQNSDRRDISVKLSTTNNDYTCKTDKYGSCIVNMDISPGETINGEATVKNDNLKSSFKIQKVNAGSSPNKIYFAHGYNIFATTGGSTTNCINFKIVKPDGEKVNDQVKDLNGIYWIYVYDNNCSMTINMNKELSEDIDNNFEFYSPKSMELISNSAFSEALEWDRVYNKFISTNIMYPGYAYAVMKK